MDLISLMKRANYRALVVTGNAETWGIPKAFDHIQLKIKKRFVDSGILVFDLTEKFAQFERDIVKGWTDSYHARPTADNIRMFADMYIAVIDAVLPIDLSLLKIRNKRILLEKIIFNI